MYILLRIFYNYKKNADGLYCGVLPICIFF